VRQALTITEAPLAVVITALAALRTLSTTITTGADLARETVAALIGLSITVVVKAVTDLDEDRRSVALLPLSLYTERGARTADVATVQRLQILIDLSIAVVVDGVTDLLFRFAGSLAGAPSTPHTELLPRDTGALIRTAGL